MQTFEAPEDAMMRRLGNVRRVLKHCKNGTWAHSYWGGVYARLLRKAQRMRSKKHLIYESSE